MQILGCAYPKRTTIIGERLELMAGTHEGRVLVLLGYAHPKICMNYAKFYARVTRVGKQ